MAPRTRRTRRCFAPCLPGTLCECAGRTIPTSAERASEAEFFAGFKVTVDKTLQLTDEARFRWLLENRETARTLFSLDMEADAIRRQIDLERE